MNRDLRVLFIGGEAADEATVRLRLPVPAVIAEPPRSHRVARVELNRAPQALRESEWDVVLADSRLAQFSVAGVLALAREGGEELPVVVVVDEPGAEERGLTLLSEGAADFITRPGFLGLLPMLQRVCRDAQSQRRLRQSTSALLRLAKSQKFSGDDRDLAFQEILEAGARSANVALSSVWTFEYESEHRLEPSAPRGVLRTLQQFDARTGTFSSGAELKIRDFPAYFHALEEQQQIVAHDALTDPRTAQLDASYLRPRGITSMLDTGVRVGGELSGILCLEHVGPLRRWTAEEEVLASALAELVAVTFERAQRRDAEARAADSEGRFRELFQHTRDCIVLYKVVPGDGVRCEDVNPALLELLGQPKEAFIGKKPHQALPKETADVLVAKHELVLETRKALVHEHWLTLPAGRICFHTALVPFFDHQGNIHRIAAIARNVTDQRRMELELAQSSKLEALGQLAGNIAHDFNNLLVGVFGWATRLSEHTDPVAREGGQQIAQAALRARELTRQVLTFGQRQPPERSPLDLTALVRELVELLAPSLSKQTRLHVELDAAGTEVLGDAGQLHQAVLNLCTNALQSMSAGGRLTLKLDSVVVSPDFAVAHPPLSAGTHVRLQVEDTGHGMSEATMARILEPFFTTKRIGIGSGLGLSVVHGIVQGHKGALVVSSSPDQGSTFEIFLPALRPAVAERETLAGNDESLMLVDDQLNVARSSAILLNQVGYRTTVFTDPREALDAFQKTPERFDVIITDLSMPQMSGAELVTAVHAIRPALPMILTSGRPVSDEERRAFGVDEVLEKPWRVEEAMRALRRALGRRAQPLPLSPR